MKAAIAAAGLLLLATASATEAVNQSIAEAELEAANRSYQQAVIDAEHAVAKIESLAEQFNNVYRNEALVQAFAADIEERVRLEAEAKNLSLEKQAEALQEVYYINRSAHKMLAHQLKKEARGAGRAVVKSGREVEHAAKRAGLEYERDYEHTERTGEGLAGAGERAGESAEDSVERLYDRVERKVEQKAHELRAQGEVKALEAAEKAADAAEKAAKGKVKEAKAEKKLAKKQLKEDKGKVKEAKAEKKLAKKQLKEDRSRAKEGDREAEKEGEAEAKSGLAATRASLFPLRWPQPQEPAGPRARPPGTAVTAALIATAACMAPCMVAALVACVVSCKNGLLSRQGVVLDAPALG